MKRIIFTLLGIFAISSFALGQNARNILDKASENYNKSNGVIASFTLNTKDSKTKNLYSQDGKAYMKGNKFKIEIPDAITWFNGTTQWSYIKDTEEVNITTPSSDELQGISPSILFSIYKKGFNLTYKGEKKQGNKNCFEVELTAQKRNTDLSKITVLIDKATYNFSKIVLTDKSGLQNELIIKSYQTGANLTEPTFEFNKKDYPKAEIVDLR